MRLQLLLLAGLCVVRAAAASADELPWEAYVKSGKGESPFKQHTYDGGFLTLKVPRTWKVVATKKSDEERLLAHPTGLKGEPHTAYLLIFIRLPRGVSPDVLRERLAALTDKMKDRLVAADSSRRLKTIGKARDTVFRGKPVREYSLEGQTGNVPIHGQLHGTFNDRAVLMMLHFWPRGRTAPYPRLFDHIDRSLTFASTPEEQTFDGGGWRAWLPADWTGEAMTFGGKPAHTLAPRILRTRPDKHAARMIVRELSGPGLTKLDGAALARNVAANTVNTNPALKAGEPKKIPLPDKLEATRIALTGKFKSGMVAEVWIVTVKVAPQRGYLMMAMGGPEKMKAAGPILEKIVRSFQVTRKKQ